MLIVFEMYVTPEFKEDAFLSDEARAETEARVLTREEALSLEIQGLPEPRAEGEVRYVPVNARHRHWIERAIDMSSHVRTYVVHDVGG